MLYIFNKTIPNSKNILYSLTFLYGINKYQSKKICENIGINPQTNLNKLKNNHVNRLTGYINKNLRVEDKLRIFKKNQIAKLLGIKLIRGIRKSIGLPVRGQRTHTNAKTCKKSRFLHSSVKPNKFKKKGKGKVKLNVKTPTKRKK